MKLLVDTRADLTVLSTDDFRRLGAQKRFDLEEVSIDMTVADGRLWKFQIKAGEHEVMHVVLLAGIRTDAFSCKGITFYVVVEGTCSVRRSLTGPRKGKLHKFECIGGTGGSETPA